MNIRHDKAEGRSPWISVIKSKVGNESNCPSAKISDNNSSQTKTSLATYSLFAPDYRLATTFSELMWYHMIRAELKLAYNKK